MHIQRTEAYHLLTGLQNKGIVSATFEYPVRFIAKPLAEALTTLIRIEKEKFVVLEKRRLELVELWESLPKRVMESAPEERFQILEGRNQTYQRAKEMEQKADKEICVAALQRDLARLDHHSFVEGLIQLQSKGVSVKLLLGVSNTNSGMTSDIRVNETKISPSHIEDLPHFIVVDNKELLFFLNKSDLHWKNVTALWTNCETLVRSMSLFFYEIWQSGQFVNPK